MSVSTDLDEPAIPPRLRRPLAALWISLGVHAALIALVQVAPPVSLELGEAVIEARLVPAHATPAAAETPPAPAAEAPEDKPDKPDKPPVPLRVPSETVVLPAAEPEGEPLAEAVDLLAEAAEPLAEVAEPPAEAAEPDSPAPALLPAEPPAEPPSAAAPATAPAPLAALTTAVDLTYYGVRDLDVQPRALREIVPDYPAAADRKRLSGKVRLQLKLEVDGRISDIDVVSATPPGVFDESAIQAFREARFAPAQKNGRPVRAQVVIEVLYDWEGRR
jgi:periplasmic protein TonB